MAETYFKDAPTERVFVDMGVCIDSYDKATALVLKLGAMLSNCYGEAGETFRNMSDDTQDNYLWACSGMADDLEKAIDLLLKQKETPNA